MYTYMYMKNIAGTLKNTAKYAKAEGRSEYAKHKKVVGSSAIHASRAHAIV